MIYIICYICYIYIMCIFHTLLHIADNLREYQLIARHEKITWRQNSEVKGGNAKCTSYEIFKIKSYLIFSLSFILGRIIQNINTSDNEQEVPEIIVQQQDNARSEVVQKMKRISKSRCNILPRFWRQVSPNPQHFLGNCL